MYISSIVLLNCPLAALWVIFILVMAFLVSQGAVLYFLYRRRKRERYIALQKIRYFNSLLGNILSKMRMQSDKINSLNDRIVSLPYEDHRLEVIGYRELNRILEVFRSELFTAFILVHGERGDRFYMRIRDRLELVKGLNDRLCELSSCHDRNFSNDLSFVNDRIDMLLSLFNTRLNRIDKESEEYGVIVDILNTAADLNQGCVNNRTSNLSGYKDDFLGKVLNGYVVKNFDNRFSDRLIGLIIPALTRLRRIKTDSTLFIRDCYDVWDETEPYLPELESYLRELEEF